MGLTNISRTSANLNESLRKYPPEYVQECAKLHCNVSTLSTVSPRITHGIKTVEFLPFHLGVEGTVICFWTTIFFLSKVLHISDNFKKVIFSRTCVQFFSKELVNEMYWCYKVSTFICRKFSESFSMPFIFLRSQSGQSWQSFVKKNYSSSHT